MSTCLGIVDIPGTECIGESRVRINGYFSKLQTIACQLSNLTINVADTPAIDLTLTNLGTSRLLTGTLSAGAIHEQVQESVLNDADEFLFWKASDNELRKVQYSDFAPDFRDPSKLCAYIGENRMDASSYGNSFFVMEDGTLKACGLNTDGAIGTGRRNNEKVTLPNLCSFNPPIASNDKVVKVVVNYNTSFAITQNGLLYSTGVNSQGQLGLGDLVTRYVFTRVTGGTPAISTKVVVDVQLGTGNNNASNAVHVLTQDGLVYAFGDGTSGSLGFGNTTDKNSTPAQVTTGIGGKTITQILTVGGNNKSTAFVLASDGTVWSAGDNTNGQLGRPGASAAARQTFQQITFTENINKLWGAGDAAIATVWARGVSGNIYAWGYNGTYKAAGNNSTADITSPTQITNLDPSGGQYVENIYGSVDSSTVTLFAKYTDGNIKAWGRNNNGQLGNGNTTAVSIPSFIDWPTTSGFSASQVIDISVAAGSNGNTATAFVLNNGKVYVAGFGQFGLLGRGGNPTSQTNFQEILVDPKVGTATKVLMGNHDTSNQTFFKALLSNGKVLAWGWQSASVPQLGTDATPNPEFTPSLVLF